MALDLGEVFAAKFKAQHDPMHQYVSKTLDQDIESSKVERGNLRATVAMKLSDHLDELDKRPNGGDADVRAKLKQILSDL